MVTLTGWGTHVQAHSCGRWPTSQPKTVAFHSTHHHLKLSCLLLPAPLTRSRLPESSLLFCCLLPYPLGQAHGRWSKSSVNQWVRASVCAWVSELLAWVKLTGEDASPNFVTNLIEWRGLKFPGAVAPWLDLLLLCLSFTNLVSLDCFRWNNFQSYNLTLCALENHPQIQI